MAHHGVDGVGVGDRGQPLRLLDAGAGEHVLGEHLALDGAAAVFRIEVDEGGPDLVDDGDLVPALVEAEGQLRAHAPAADHDDEH